MHGKVGGRVKTRVSDSRTFEADPDPATFGNTDPDPGPLQR